MNTKAQVSTTDFIISLLIMISAILMAVSLIANLEDPSDFATVQQRAYDASQILMSEGYPVNWTSSSFIRVGLLTDNKLNVSKLANLSDIEYSDIRQRLVGNYDFYLYFSNATGSVKLSSCGFGSSEVSYDVSCTPDLDFDNDVAHIQRLVAYNNSVIQLNMVVWN